MESTTCIFNYNKTECRGPKRTHLTMLMCAKHMKDFLGLEKFNVIHETETTYDYVSGFLRPAKGHVLKRNTLIYPDRIQFDKHFRPEDEAPTADDLKYHINPSIKEFMRNALKRKDNGLESRFCMEMIRNMPHPPKAVNMGPYAGQDVLMKNALILISSKLNISESIIEKQSIYKHIKGKCSLTIKGQETKLEDCELSVCMQYFLSNCLFQCHEISDTMVTDSIMFNAEYKPGIGLVATEDIAYPMPIVIAGVSKGSQILYNSMVVSIKKDILSREVSLRDLPEHFKEQEVFRGGSSNCLW